MSPRTDGEPGQGRADLVLTVPPSFGIDAGSGFLARSTLGVLVELLAEARKHVLMGAPFVEEAGALLEGPVGVALNATLERRVFVDLVTADQTLAHESFRKLRTSHPNLFHVFHPAEIGGRSVSYFSHAKFCISDDKAAYVGSANFTRNGIQGNLEMGLLLRGPPVAGVVNFFAYMFEHGYLVEVSR